MPLLMRLPKRGFTHVRIHPIEVVNVRDLNRFPAGAVVDPAALIEARLVASPRALVKILGDGELQHSLTVKAHRFSKSALEKIAACGGKTEGLKSGC